MTRLFVGAGRSGRDPAAGPGRRDRRRVAPQRRDIGAIEITDRFSLVEVPEAVADEVVEALRHSRIRGRKTGVRREAWPGWPTSCGEQGGLTVDWLL